MLVLQPFQCVTPVLGVFPVCQQNYYIIWNMYVLFEQIYTGKYLNEVQHLTGFLIFYYYTIIGICNILIGYTFNFKEAVRAKVKFGGIYLLGRTL